MSERHDHLEQRFVTAFVRWASLAAWGSLLRMKFLNAQNKIYKITKKANCIKMKLSEF